MLEHVWGLVLVRGVGVGLLDLTVMKIKMLFACFTDRKKSVCQAGQRQDLCESEVSHPRNNFRMGI